MLYSDLHRGRGKGLEHGVIFCQELQTTLQESASAAVWLPGPAGEQLCQHVLHQVSEENNSLLMPVTHCIHREDIAAHKEDFFKRKLLENADKPE